VVKMVRRGGRCHGPSAGIVVETKVMGPAVGAGQRDGGAAADWRGAGFALYSSVQARSQQVDAAQSTGA
jgi:hypothetical protein